MTTPYVHVEVVELRRGSPFQPLEAEVRVFFPGGPPFTLIVRAGGSQQPFWRVLALEPVGSEEILEAVYERISPEEFCYRISVALTMANLWDSAKASSDRLWEMDGGRDD